MEIFLPILEQMLFLFVFIAIGFLLSKFKILHDDAAKTISILENYVFVPGLVLFTFLEKCTIETLSSVGNLVLLSFLMVAILIPTSLFVSKLCFKEKNLRNIATYGLAFSNFGFMGNAIMSSIFPEIFFEYTIFTLPFWFMIYLWGVPVLLMSKDADDEKGKFINRLKSFVNPMLIAMFIGIILGLVDAGKYLPTSIKSVIKVSGDCMSPIAMILTGITIGRSNILELIKKWRIYLTSIIRLLVYPLAILLLLYLLPQNNFFTPTFYKCAICMAAMPMGLNAIVVPAAYGRDPTDAAGMALISHVMSIGTIPLIFMLLEICFG